MSTSEMAMKVHQLSAAVDQIKNVNDRKIAEIEKKSDPVWKINFAELSKKIENQDISIQKLKSVINRPSSEISKKYNDADQEYNNQFSNYLRKGVEPSMNQKSINQGLGYSVSSSVSDSINLYMEESSEIRKIANVTEISTEVFEVIDPRDNLSTSWEDTTEISKNDLNFKSIKIYTKMLYCNFSLHQRVVSDPRIDIDSIVSLNISNAINQETNKAFILGDGKNQPHGIISEKLDSLDVEEITIKNLQDFIAKLDQRYMKKAVFLMNYKNFYKLKSLEKTEGFTKDFFAKNFLGIEIITTSDMPDNVIAFGDFKLGYQIVDRSNFSLIVDNLTEKGKVSYFCTAQVGGDIVNSDAIKLLKIMS